MQRFGIRLTTDEFNLLMSQIDDFTLRPVFISRDGRMSFHPWNFHGQKLVVLFDWTYNVPVTVYNENWFIKKETHWIPHTKRKEKAKVRRRREKDQAKVNLKPSYLKYKC